MTLLITGAMGHCGLEVVRQAARRGHAILAQYRGTFDADAAAACGANVRWVRADLTDAGAVAAMVETHGVTAAIHTAAVPNDSVARPDPANAAATNVMAVVTLLDLARRHGWRRMVNVSTGSVFQKSDDVTKPILEDQPPAVTNVYSTTKHCGELLTTMYRTQYDVPASTIRVSWVYGPPLVPKVRDNPRGPIPWFLKLALSGIPVEEASGGDFAASFTHVGDVAAGLIAAVEAEVLRHPVYHLGWGRNFTTSEVAAAVRLAVPEARITVGSGTAPWTDHTRMRGPLAGDRLRVDTGFVPKLDLEAGIAAFADWMRSNRKAWA